MVLKVIGFLACLALIIACVRISGLARWLALLPIHIVAKIAAWSFSSLAANYFMTDDGLGLRWPFGWMMTKDNDLEGTAIGAWSVWAGVSTIVQRKRKLRG